MAQGGFRITGQILSAEDNLPVIGVSVVEKGTTNGVITDIDGNYSITVSKSPATLQFSYVGMKTVEKLFTAATRYNVIMQPNTEMVDEVVVVAYGVRKKGTIAGSVSTVKAEKMENVPAAGFDQALQGQTPGLSVISNSGEPSKAAVFQIRGTNSINSGTSPLFILDGVQEYVNSTTGLKFVVGHPVHEYFLNRYAGVNPANGDALWYTKDGELTTEFNESDKVMTGNTFDSPWAGGFGTTFAWKGLSLSAQFSWMADRWVMNNDRFFEESNGLYSTYNQSRRLLYDRWKKPGDITDIPRYGVTAQLDDRFLENSSFLRLKNLTLAYALPQPLLKKTNFFTSARVYLQGQNLLTFTGFTGLDPEMSSNIYRAQYPASRQFTLGIEVSF